MISFQAINEMTGALCPVRESNGNTGPAKGGVTGAAVMENSLRLRSEKLVKTEHLSEKLTKPKAT